MVSFFYKEALFGYDDYCLDYEGKYMNKVIIKARQEIVMKIVIIPGSIGSNSYNIKFDKY